VDSDVDRHSGKIQQRPHRVTPQQQPNEKPYDLVRKPAFEPQDRVEKKDQPFVQILKRVNAVSADFRDLLFEADLEDRFGSFVFRNAGDVACGDGDLVRSENVQQRQQVEFD